jgi:hypothetical protein
MVTIGVEAEYISIAKSLYGRGPNGEPNALIATERKFADFLRQRRCCSCSSGLL